MDETGMSKNELIVTEMLGKPLALLHPFAKFTSVFNDSMYYEPTVNS